MWPKILHFCRSRKLLPVNKHSTIRTRFPETKISWPLLTCKYLILAFWPCMSTAFGYIWHYSILKQLLWCFTSTWLPDCSYIFNSSNRNGCTASQSSKEKRLKRSSFRGVANVDLSDSQRLHNWCSYQSCQSLSRVLSILSRCSCSQDCSLTDRLPISDPVGIGLSHLQPDRDFITKALFCW